jgi:type II secretory pathway predicted ATPase ExeA
MKFAIVPTSNLDRVLSTAEQLLKRAVGLPGMAAVIGTPGAGKTIATGCAATRFNAIYERALPTWTTRAMLAALCGHLGLRPSPRIEPMWNAIIGALRARPRLVIIDEADLIRDFVTIEMLRALYDLSEAPVMLVGTPNFRQRLRRHEQLAARMLRTVEFVPLSIEEVCQVVSRLSDVIFDEELIERLHKSAHSFRRLVVEIAALERRAVRVGAQRVTLADWPGAAPAEPARRVA